MGIISKIKDFFRGGKTTLTIDNRETFTWDGSDLATNETIFSTVTLLSNSMASLPLKLYKDSKAVNPGETQIARLLKYGPNNFMTPFNFIRALEVTRDTKGNAYAVIDYDEFFQPCSIWILDSSKVEPIIEKDTKELYYKILTDDGVRYMHNSHIIHVNHIFTSNNYKGISPLDVLRDSIDYDKEVKEFSLSQMRNGLKANLVIKVATSLTEEQLKEYRKVIDSFRNSGILMLDQGKDLQELKNISFIDPKVFEVENITIARVARVYNVPLNKVLADKQSYNSAEQADLEYMKDTILPIARLYEHEFNKKLLSEKQRDEGYYFEFSLNGFHRADMKTRAEYYFKGIRSMWLTSNEIRRFEGLPPVEGGDELYCSRDMIEVSKLDLLLKGGETSGGKQE